VPSDRLVGRLATGVTIGCAALVAITIAALAFPAVRSWLGVSSARSTSYSVGQQIDVPASLYDTSAATLLIFARSTCGVCQSAKPVFAALAAELRALPQARVLVLASNTSGDERVYVRDLGLQDTQLVTMSFGGLRLKVVPTLVLVNRRGAVEYTAEGVPSAVQQRELLVAAKTLAPPR
jgi:thiol-disulfide isomerase/thioredoxin